MVDNSLSPEEQIVVIQSIQASLSSLSDKNQDEAYHPFYSAAMKALITLERAIEIDTKEYKGRNNHE